jgi:hypothetical protein
LWWFDKHAWLQHLTFFQGVFAMSDPHRIASDLCAGVIWNLIQDPGAVVGSNYVYMDRHLALLQIDTAGAEARTLMPPDRPGLIATVSLRTHGGDLALLVSGTFDGTNSTINYTAAGQWATFISIEVAVDSWQWFLLQCYGVSGTGVSSALSGGASVSTLTASGLATLTGGLIIGSGAFSTLNYGTFAAGLTGGKTALTKQVCYVTCADASHVFVTLPAPAAGRIVYVLNNSAQTADVFPNAAETINATTHLTIATYKGAAFFSDGTNWIAIAGA